VGIGSLLLNQFSYLEWTEYALEEGMDKYNLFLYMRLLKLRWFRDIFPVCFRTFHLWNKYGVAHRS